LTDNFWSGRSKNRARCEKGQGGALPAAAIGSGQAIFRWIGRARSLGYSLAETPPPRLGK
jgi:hypothetical protein